MLQVPGDVCGHLVPGAGSVHRGPAEVRGRDGGHQDAAGLCRCIPQRPERVPAMGTGMHKLSSIVHHCHPYRIHSVVGEGFIYCIRV